MNVDLRPEASDDLVSAALYFNEISNGWGDYFLATIERDLAEMRALREQIVILHRRLLVIVRDDEVCRRLMTVPGVGPVVSLTYRATV